MHSLSEKQPLITLDDALKKAHKYCAYQERCQQEVRDKLYDLGLHKREVEQAISQLISDGFLNEERFAIAFAGGKFRIKQWGKIKITIALRQKKVSDYCIRTALAPINDIDYKKTLRKVMNNYAKTVKEKDLKKRNYKIAQHAVSRGFESELVWNELVIDDD